MNLREAAQAALETLEQLQGGCTDHDDGTVEAITVWCPEVIEDLRAALAAEPAQPVAWESGGYFGFLLQDLPIGVQGEARPLFDQAALDAAVAAERERCAKLCERQAQLQIATGADDGVIAQAHRCAMVIRR